MAASADTASIRDGAEKSRQPEKRRTIGDFEILGTIGRGSQGTVYRAKSLSRRRKVALKVLFPHFSLSGEAVRNFYSSLGSGQCERHPGIVPVLAAGRHRGASYIAQDLVEGGCTLAQRLKEQCREGYQPPGYFRETVKLLTAVADALQHCHAAGVVHGCLKPSSLLFAPGGRLQVSDFCLVKPVNPLDMPRAGGLPGTPCYLAPEQVPGSRAGIDPRTDVFSLGVILYEMITLERPFDGETPQQVLKKIVLKEPRRPRKVNPDVPRDLAVIALKSMEKDPAHRYQTMADLDHDLRRFLTGDVILAKPTGVAATVWKRIKRHPAKSVADAVTAAAVFLVVVVAPWLIAWSERDRRSDLEEVYSGPVQSVLAPGEGTAFTGAQAATLDEAAAIIESSFADRPEFEASLRVPLGWAFFRIGRYDDARIQFARALELREALSGSDDPKTLAIRANLAEVIAVMTGASGSLGEPAGFMGEPSGSMDEPPGSETGPAPGGPEESGL
jgi:hypothetical protein